MRKLILAGVVAMTLGAASAHADPILVNGDFGTNDFTGWSTSGAMLVANSAAYVAGASSTGDTGTGSFATFGAFDLGPTGVLSQSIGTVIGQTYNLSFSYGAAGSNAVVQAILVTAGDLSQTVTSAASTNNLTTALVDYTFSFTATGSSTTITFSDMSAETISVDALLDNVGIPEPASMLVLGAGLIALAGARRRRTEG